MERSGLDGSWQGERGGERCWVGIWVCEIVFDEIFYLFILDTSVFHGLRAERMVSLLDLSEKDSQPVL